VKLLVTGGSGFLGSELVCQARASGWEVAATYRTRPVEGAVPLDVTDEAAVEALVARVRPDVVVHTAYLLSGDGLWPVTAEGAAAAARACERHGARLVHLSTDLVFDGARGGYTEADPPGPIIPYGEAKAAAERLVAAACPGALVVRTSLLLDGAEPGPQELRPLAAARGELAMGFFTDELRSPVSVRDLAAALLEAGPRRELSGPLHLAGPDTVDRHELARLVCRRHGVDPALLQAALAAGLPDPRPLNCSLDSSRAVALLATRLRGIREVLAA
jgi:dTDP-4-dehydrorhamnose reductase